MYVKLAANWFGPDGRRYRMNREGDLLTYVPDELAEKLPSTAKIVSWGNEKPAEPVTRETRGLRLRDFDQTRAAADVVAEVAEKADAELLRRRQEQAARMRAAKAAKKDANS